MSDSDACEWYIWAMAITIIVFQNLRIEKCQLSDVRMVHQPIGNTTVGGTVMSHDHKTKTMWQHTRRWSSWPTSRQSKIGMIIYDSQSMYWSMSLAPLGLVNLVKAKSHSLVPQIRNRVFFVGVNRLSTCAGWICEASILLSCSHQQVRQSMV
jgi:hypothetical protein